MAHASDQFRMQEIHTPSAFEGALWAVMGIRDAAVIFHGPPGCAINQHVNVLVNEWRAELYSTNLSYGDVMQGAEGRLETVLRQVAARAPAAIVVVTAPTVEVTHDDVEGVAHKVGFVPTIVVRPPIGGSLGVGKDAALLALLDLATPQTVRPRTVNLIGPTCNTFNWMADVYELRRMLAGIGVEVNCVLSAGSTVGEIGRAAAAALNVCIYPYDCGIAVAEEMARRFNTPFLSDPIPIGVGQSARWLEQVAHALEVDAGPFLHSSIRNGWQFMQANMAFTVTFEMTAALLCDNHNTYAAGIAEFLTAEAGTRIVLSSVSSTRAADAVSRVCDRVLVAPTIEEKREALVNSAPMAIYGNFYDKKVSMDEGFTNFIFADIPTIGYLHSENCPFMGFMGAKYLVQSLVNEVYMGIFLETKGEMRGPISGGAAEWEVAAQEAMVRVGEMIPHFVRATALKKLHQMAEQAAVERQTAVTVAIIREVADAYTPTKFKAKFDALFETGPCARVQSEDDDAREDEEEAEVPIDSLACSMPWDEDARQVLAEVPSPFRQAAVSGTEDWAREHGSERVSARVMAEFRAALGM